MGMTLQDRLARLRQLARELERSSPSDERDALLREIRDRILLLEAGANESGAWQKRDWPHSAYPASAAPIVLER